MTESVQVIIDNKDPGLVLIRLKGEYEDLSEHLSNELDKALYNLQYKQVLDLSEINDIPKEGVGLMFRHLQKLRENNGNLVLLKPNRNFKTTLKEMEAKGIFDIVRTQKDAKEVLNKKPLKQITSYIRLHAREVMATNNTITLQDHQNFQHTVMLYDTSDAGLGIVYVGDYCPQIHDSFDIIDDNRGKRKKVKKKAVVCWINCLGNKLYRIGLTYEAE